MIINFLTLLILKMYSSQLDSAIKDAEKNVIQRARREMSESHVSPYLGFVNLDEIDDNYKSYRKSLQNCLKKQRCACKEYNALSKDVTTFMLVNNTFEVENGEHWYLIGFNPSIRNTFFSFNTYGLAHTTRSFGYGAYKKNSKALNRHTNEVITNDKNSYYYRQSRRNELSALVQMVWKNEEDVKFVGFQGIHQDITTDTCGYHVLRFCEFLFERIFLSDNNGIQINEKEWETILQHYLKHFKINFFPYHFKPFKRAEVQNQLLQNDLAVKKIIENPIPHSPYSIKREENKIFVHHELSMSDDEWSSHLSPLISYVLFEAVTINNRTENYTFTIQIENSDSKTTMGKTKRDRKRKYDPHDGSVNPYKNDNGEQVKEIPYISENQSEAKKILLSTFPNDPTLKNINLISSGVTFPEMQNKHFLKETILQLPGDESTLTSVYDYYKSLGVFLSAKDPYSYLLSKKIKQKMDDLFERKQIAVFQRNLNKEYAKTWKYVEL